MKKKNNNVDFLDEKLVGENDKSRFYKNFFCEKYKGYDILLAELKSTKKRTYVIVKDGKYVGDDNTIEGIYYQIDILKLMEQSHKKRRQKK